MTRNTTTSFYCASKICVVNGSPTWCLLAKEWKSHSRRQPEARVAEVRDDVNELNSETMTSWQQALSSESMHEKLKGKLARIPQAFNIAVADAGGQVLASTARWPAPAIKIADRDYFRNARAQAAPHQAGVEQCCA